MSLFRNLFATWDDRFNPVSVKEIRQAARGFFLAGLLLFFLIIQLIALGLFMGDKSSHDLMGRGSDLMMVFLSVLFFVTLFCMPTFITIRIAMERSDDNIDLLYISTMSPEKIIRGKMATAMIITALFFLATLPFMSLTYFLRGVDMPTVLLVFIMAYSMVITWIQIYVCAACVIPGRILRILAGIALLVGTSIVYGVGVSLLSATAESATASSLLAGEYLGGAAIIALAAIFLLGGLFMISVAAIKPVSLNRAMPVRIYITSWWLLYFVADHIFTNPGITWRIWALIGVILGSINMLVAICERDEPSHRTRGKIPNSRLKRSLYFLFSSGSSNGFTWSFAFITLSLLASLFDNHPLDPEFWEVLYGVGVYTGCYGLTTHLLYRSFLARFIRKPYAWLIALGLIILGSAAPVLTAFMVHGSFSIDNLTGFWHLTNPFAALQVKERGFYLIFANFWLLGVMLLEMRWFFRQYRAFKPLPATEPTMGELVQNAD